MKKFLAVYTGSPDSLSKWNALSDAERQQRTIAGMAAWHQWMDRHKQVIDEIG